MIRLLLLLLPLLFAAPPGAFAGDACRPAPSKQPAAPGAEPHAGHDHAKEERPADPHEGHDHTARPSAPDAEPHAGHEHGSGGHDGHAHGGPGPVHALPFAEIAEAACEHGVKTIDCDRCRFEVGVVRVDPSSNLFKIERPAAAAASNTLDLPGECRLAADRVRVISSRFPARLVSIAVRVGDAVAEGDPLAEVESPDLAQAALDLLKRSAELSFAERRFMRDTPLAERRMITDQEYLDGRAAYELASLEVRLARKRLLLLGLADEAVERLAVDPDHPALLGRFTIRAPIAGRIVARDCEVGEMLPVDHALLTLADLSTLWVVAQCHERDLPALRAALAAKADTVTLETLSAPGRAFTGRIFALDPALSRETRTLPVWIEAGNADGLLAAGMFCRARLAAPASAGALTLPAEAVLDDEGRSFVFLRVRGDLFMTRVVESLPLPGGRVAVTGIPADAEVVTMGAFLLKSDVLREKMGAGCAD